MGQRILIVDDQKGVRRLLEELFNREGWQVSTAANGREAIDKVEESLPDIILMDMKMPNMNGLEASQIILQNHPDMIILMMTAYGEMDVITSAMDAGVKKCINKPFDIIVLKDMVNKLVMDNLS